MRYLIIILLAVVYSCKQDGLQPKEYAMYIAEDANQLHKTVDAGSVTYALQYKPLDFIVSNELKKDKISSETLKNRKEVLKGLQYYSLRMTSKIGGDVMKLGVNSNNQYFDKINYYSFDFKHDIILVEGKDTLTCKLFHFVRSHGTTPYVDFVFAFEDKQTTIDKEIYIYDQATLQDVLHFTIKNNDIKQIPELQTY